MNQTISKAIKKEYRVYRKKKKKTTKISVIFS